MSSYNLTIFILCAEVRPLRHLIKLVRARTFHLQRVVHANPYRSREEKMQTVETARLDDLVGRLHDLESRLGGLDQPNGQATHNETKAMRREREDLTQELLEQIKPKLNTLASAIRKTHRQQRDYSEQIDTRLKAIDSKANSAVAVAKIAERNSRTLWTSIAWLIDWVMFFLLFPLRLVLAQGNWALTKLIELLAVRSPERPSPLLGKTRQGARTASKPGTKSALRLSKK